jgi:hypothetical protein
MSEVVHTDFITTIAQATYLRKNWAIAMRVEIAGCSPHSQVPRSLLAILHPLTCSIFHHGGVIVPIHFIIIAYQYQQLNIHIQPSHLPYACSCHSCLTSSSHCPEILLTPHSHPQDKPAMHSLPIQLKATKPMIPSLPIVVSPSLPHRQDLAVRKAEVFLHTHL